MEFTLDQVKSFFKNQFGIPDIILGASGRANIIGEHTDYNLGYVFPFAISQKIYFAASINHNANWNVHALNMNESYHNNDQYLPGSWQHFVDSTIAVISNKYGDIQSMNLVIGGNLPVGAGISSSSALCCGLVTLISEINHLPLTQKEKVLLASEIEHGSGVNGGLMDQYAILYGIENEALILDCKALTHINVIIPNDWHFFLINTGVKHNLVNTAYNDRRAVCESVVKKMQKDFSKIQSLRDVNLEMLYAFEHLLSKEELIKAQFVIKENNRVIQFQEAIYNNNILRAGELLSESHFGLSNQYEVSCQELDYLQNVSIKHSSIVGSRMMGGGFGGCTINLTVSDSNWQSEVNEILVQYKNKWQQDASLISIQPSKGIEIYKDER